MHSKMSQETNLQLSFSHVNIRPENPSKYDKTSSVCSKGVHNGSDEAWINLGALSGRNFASRRLCREIRSVALVK